ncbi:hypothetical protein ACLOAV_005925 [Pseudogymnoascus australis]
MPNGDPIAATTGTTGDQGLRKQTSTRRGLTSRQDNNNNNDNVCSTSVSRNPVVSSGHREDTSDLLGSSGPVPGDNSSFIPTRHGHENVAMSDIAAPNDFGLNSLDPTDNGTQGFNDTIPQPNFGYSDLDRFGMSDVARSDFGSLINSDARNPITWDNSTYNIDSENSSDSLGTSVEIIDTPNTSKGYTRNQGSIFDDVLQNSNFKTHSNGNSDPTLSVPVPTSSEDVANTAAPINPTEGASPKASSANTCMCLQKHAEVLSNPILSEIRASDGPNDGVCSMDKALSLAQQAMKAWQGLLTCPYCPYNDDQEVMLLTFMTIQAITRYLRRLSPRYTNAARTNLQASNPDTPLAAKDDSRLRIGSFELEGDDRTLVLRFLYQNTLQKVMCVLHSLQVIQNKKKKRLLEETQNKLAGVDDYQASSNLFHIQQMSYGLVTSLQTLESALNDK